MEHCGIAQPPYTSPLLGTEEPSYMRGLSVGSSVIVFALHRSKLRYDAATHSVDEVKMRNGRTSIVEKLTAEEKALCSFF